MPLRIAQHFTSRVEWKIVSLIGITSVKTAKTELRPDSLKFLTWQFFNTSRSRTHREDNSQNKLTKTYITVNLRDGKFFQTTSDKQQEKQQ